MIVEKHTSLTAALLKTNAKVAIKNRPFLDIAPARKFHNRKIRINVWQQQACILARERQRLMNYPLANVIVLTDCGMQQTGWWTTLNKEKLYAVGKSECSEKF